MRDITNGNECENKKKKKKSSMSSKLYLLGIKKVIWRRVMANMCGRALNTAVDYRIHVQ